MKKAYIFNERTKLHYNDGSPVTIGNKIIHNGKTGRIKSVNFDTVSIEYDDGSGMDHVELRQVRKIASIINSEKLIKEIVQMQRK